MKSLLRWIRVCVCSFFFFFLQNSYSLSHLFPSMAPLPHSGSSTSSLHRPGNVVKEWGGACKRWPTRRAAKSFAAGGERLPLYCSFYFSSPGSLPRRGSSTPSFPSWRSHGDKAVFRPLARSSWRTCSHPQDLLSHFLDGPSVDSRKPARVAPIIPHHPLQQIKNCREATRAVAVFTYYWTRIHEAYTPRTVTLNSMGKGSRSHT